MCFASKKVKVLHSLVGVGEVGAGGPLYLRISYLRQNIAFFLCCYSCPHTNCYITVDQFHVFLDMMRELAEKKSCWFS